MCVLTADRDPPVSVVHYFEGRFTSFSRDVFGHIPSCICHALDEMALIHARKLGQQRGKALEEKTRPSSRSSTLAAVTQNVNLGEDESKKDGKKERAVAYGRLAKLAAKIAQFAKARCCLSGLQEFRFAMDCDFSSTVFRVCVVAQSYFILVQISAVVQNSILVDICVRRGSTFRRRGFSELRVAGNM